MNGWKSDLYMKNAGGARWTLTLDFPAEAAGQKVYFKFVVNGKDWLLSSNFGQEGDSKGIPNNVVSLPGQGVPSIKSSGLFVSKGKPQEAL
jgi:hypothetical protein